MQISAREFHQAVEAASVVLKKYDAIATLASRDGDVRVWAVDGLSAKPNRMELSVSTRMVAVEAGTHLEDGAWHVDVRKASDVAQELATIGRPVHLDSARGRLMLRMETGSVQIGTRIADGHMGILKREESQAPHVRVPDGEPAFRFSQHDSLAICPLWEMSARWSSDRREQFTCVEVETVDGRAFAAATEGASGVVREISDMDVAIESAPLWLHRSVMKHLATGPNYSPPFDVRRSQVFTRLDCGNTSWSWRHGAPHGLAGRTHAMRKPVAAVIHVTPELVSALRLAKAIRPVPRSYDGAVVLRSDDPNVLWVTSNGTGDGPYIDIRVNTTIDGELPAVCINAALLFAGIAHTFETQRIEIAGPRDPVFISGAGGTGIVMPMRM